MPDPVRSNTQTAPYPHTLADLVARLRYRPGWRFDLRDIVRDPAERDRGEAAGLTFSVTTIGYDSYHPENGQHYRVVHHFPVPAATYGWEAWRRWLLDCLLKVETHEACEFFALAAGACTCDDVQRRDFPCQHEPGCPEAMRERPFAPTHGPGQDPYVVHEYADDLARRTQFTGAVNDA